MERNTSAVSKKVKKKRDLFVKIATAQLMLFTAIFVSVLLTVRYFPEKGEKLKEQYAEYMRQDMDFDDIRALFDKTTVPGQTDQTTPASTIPAPEPGTTRPLPDPSSVDHAFEKETSVLFTDRDAEAAAYLDRMLLSAPVFPVDGSVTSDFGGRVSPITHFQEKHRGTDIAAPSGSPIMAVFDGTVSLVDCTPGRGNFLILDHGEDGRGKIQTLYQHCSEILVEEGTVVRAGETIALVGATGDCTGPHLHIEYRIDGECIDAIEAIFGGVYEA